LAGFFISTHSSINHYKIKNDSTMKHSIETTGGPGPQPCRSTYAPPVIEMTEVELEFGIAANSARLTGKQGSQFTVDDYTNPNEDQIAGDIVLQP
jgi:hypothetical protein